MTDYREVPEFKAKLAAVEAAIDVLAKEGKPDAMALVDRELGGNNLQGHRHTLVPLAVAFLLKNRAVLDAIRQSTDLDHSMGTGSSEARASFWNEAKARMTIFIADDGHDIVSSKMSNDEPQTVADAASYLSRSWGGLQTSGGGGDTVVKRTLKLVAHTF